MAGARRNPRNTGLGLMDRHGCCGQSLRVGIPIAAKINASCASQLSGGPKKKIPRRGKDPPKKEQKEELRGGEVVLEGEPLAEGSVVTVVSREDDEAFDASPEEERALVAAIAQAERGQVVSWEELREQLRRFG